MAVSELIELTQEMKDRIVQRWPERGEGRIKMGAQLIVSQGQAAVFYRDGKSLDVFGPGRHTLTTANVPLVTKLFSKLLTGEDSIFSATVFYVAVREHAAIIGHFQTPADLGIDHFVYARVAQVFNQVP